MNVLINKKNIRRFLDFFEEENISINGRVKSIEIEKKKLNQLSKNQKIEKKNIRNH